MAGYKDPAFQDRVASAAAAKQKALEKLRAKPQVDPAVLAERNTARLAKEAAIAEERAAKIAARKQAEAEAAEAAAAAKAAEEEERARIEEEKAKAVPTEAERKAARDARYAARKQKRK